MKKIIFNSFICMLLVACGSNPKATNKSSVVRDTIPDTAFLAQPEAASHSVLDDVIMDGYDTTQFAVVFDNEGIEILSRDIGYQHGHTLQALVMNLYRKEKMIFTDTIPFHADASEYELQYFEDGTPLIKISGAWANFGATSYQEYFYIIEKDSIFWLEEVSGYCAGDHYNFDSDTNCVTEFNDSHEFHYSLSRKKGQKYISVLKKGMDLSAEDPCKTGFDTLAFTEKWVMNRDTMVVYYSEEKRAGKTKILVSLPREKAVKKLLSLYK
jgi:hypothetical protein